MPIKSTPMGFEQPWRRNFEKYQCCAWSGCALGYGLYGLLGSVPAGPCFAIASVAAIMAAYRMPGAVKLERLQKKLVGRDLTLITVPELQKLTTNELHMNDMWLGRGFVWTNKHTQRLYSMMDKDWSRVAKESRENSLRDVEHWGKDIINSTKDVVFDKTEVQDFRIEEMGQHWIHGVESDECDLWQPIQHVAGHTLIVGTTGAGKTRCFDLLITQAIAKGECVIIIDPKGDIEMRDNARAACEECGRLGDFVMFHPAFPEESTPIDPLANYSDISDIPSRISALLSGGGSSESFKNFSWLAMNQVCQAMHYLDINPSLRNIISYLQMGGDELLEKCVKKFGYEHLGKNTFDEYFKSTNPFDPETGKPLDRFWTPTKGYTILYREYLKPDFPNPAIEGLISFCEHDKAHFAKMVASLIPILSMLTSGTTGDMLSPISSEKNAARETAEGKPFRDMKWFIKKKKVVYIGLNSLSNAVVGSALGSIFLSDLTSVAGEKYNFAVDGPVSIYVDETSEVVNEPLIQMLNKGRGAGFRIFIATQLISDFAARLGSKDKAAQLLGNLNNCIALRTIEPDTQEFLIGKMPKTRVHHIEHSQNVSINAETPTEHGSSISERLVTQEVPLFPPELFGSLPSLEFIAILSGGSVLKGRIPIVTRHANHSESDR